MKQEIEANWTWADHIGSYRFWAIMIFLLSITVPSQFWNILFNSFVKDHPILTFETIANAASWHQIATLGGLWPAWLVLRRKNHYFLFVFPAVTVISFLCVRLFPSPTVLLLCAIITGIIVVAMLLVAVGLIAGVKGQMEAIIVCLGTGYVVQSIVVAAFMIVIQKTHAAEAPNVFILMGLVMPVIGSVFLLPLKGNVFESSPPLRKSEAIPKYRNPSMVLLSYLIPMYNVYHTFSLPHRLHGEVYAINPSRKVLSPRAAAWSTLFLFFLAPIMVSSLNQALLDKVDDKNLSRFHKTRVVVIWAFIFLPVSYALIQDNLNHSLHTYFLEHQNQKGSLHPES